MDKTIILRESQVQNILNFLYKEQERLRSEIKKSETELRENDRTISALIGDSKEKVANAELFSISHNGNTVPNDYDKTWSWTVKAEFILKSVGHVLTVAEIVDHLYRYEPSLKTDSVKENRQHRGSISASISTFAISNKRFGRFIRRGSSEYTYGLKDWFGADKKLISE